MSANTPMSSSPSSLPAQQTNPFSARMVLSFVVVGFSAFLLLLYFFAIGDTGDRSNDGQAHAAANGLNGFSALAELLDKQGTDVDISRTPAGLKTNDLLILTPPMSTKPEEFGEFLEERQSRGPTIVILPKWWASGFPPVLPKEISDQVKEGWVQLGGANSPNWPAGLPDPYDVETEEDKRKGNSKVSFAGLGLSGNLPTRPVVFARDRDVHEPLVTDGSGRTLALSVLGDKDSDIYNDGYTMIFVVEPDLMNNYGMADQKRAQLALALIDEATYYDDTPVVFDVTLNGLGSSTNLLTLAFKPPFLAATLCLIAAMIVIGWRAFKRFGPPASGGPAIAFGKRRLVTNGAGLIVRARRFDMLADPYIELSAQRTRNALGISSLDHAELDAAIERRLPNEPSFTQRANAMRAARNQSDILRSARALKELERTLQS